MRKILNSRKVFYDWILNIKTSQHQIGQGLWYILLLCSTSITPPTKPNDSKTGKPLHQPNRSPTTPKPRRQWWWCVLYESKQTPTITQKFNKTDLLINNLIYKESSTLIWSFECFSRSSNESNIVSQTSQRSCSSTLVGPWYHSKRFMVSHEGRMLWISSLCLSRK